MKSRSCDKQKAAHRFSGSTLILESWEEVILPIRLCIGSKLNNALVTMLCLESSQSITDSFASGNVIKSESV